MTRELDNYNFHLEFAGTCVAGFVEVSGLSMEPGERREPPLREVVCKRGVLVGSALWQWATVVHDGEVEPRTLDIVVRAEDGSEAVRWTLVDAFVAKVEAPVFDDAGGYITVEAIAFMCAELRRR